MKTFASPSLRLPLLLAALALPGALAQTALAQPDPNNAPKADNPQNRPLGQGQGQNRANRPDRQNMTPEQRDAARKEAMARYMKRQLERMGITDAAQQDAVSTYIEGEQAAREALMESSRALSDALRADAVTDTQVAALLNTYNAAIEDDRIRRTAAQKKLGESVDLLKAPRLEAFLTLMGFYGEGTGFGAANLGGAFNRGGRPRN